MVAYLISIVNIHKTLFIRVAEAVEVHRFIAVTEVAPAYGQHQPAQLLEGRKMQPGNP